MARIIENQLNPWGRTNGMEPQRSDLWVIDFSSVLANISLNVEYLAPMTPGLAIPYVPPKLATYFSQSVLLPELKVRPDMIRRGSRPYNTPSWDEPVDAITMTFVLDSHRGGSRVDPYKSDIYQMLDLWRACVRAGRGPMSEEYAIRLDDNYRINYAADVPLLLLRGAELPTVDVMADLSAISSAEEDLAFTLMESALNGDLQGAMRFNLKRCWLASFKLSDLSQETAKVVTLTASIYAEDIQQDPEKAP